MSRERGPTAQAGSPTSPANESRRGAAEGLCELRAVGRVAFDQIESAMTEN